MAKRHYDNWLRGFIDSTAHLEAPLSMYFWVGVVAIAGALRRCVWIDQGDFKWVPNFYVVLVAPPGVVSKSTTADIAVKLLRKVPGINFGPDVVTWQSLIQELEKSCEEVDMHDGTFMPMSAMTIASSEFGTFLNPNDRDMVDMLVTLWDSRDIPLRKTTKTSGSNEIINPCVNIVSCTTPAWMEGNFPEYLIGGGLMARSIYLYADRKRQTVAYPRKHLPPNFHDLREKLAEDLVKIAAMRGEFKLTPEAEEWGEAWYAQICAERPPHMSNERFASYWARKQTHVHKLAMVVSAAQRDELIIPRKDLESANRIVSAIETDMPRVFERIGVSPQARGQAELVAIVRAHGTLSAKDLYKQLFRIMSYEDFRTAVASAVSAGLVLEAPESGSMYFKAVYGQATKADADTVREFRDGAKTEGPSGGSAGAA